MKFKDFQKNKNLFERNTFNDKFIVDGLDADAPTSSKNIKMYGGDNTVFDGLNILDDSEVLSLFDNISYNDVLKNSNTTPYDIINKQSVILMEYLSEFEYKLTETYSSNLSKPLTGLEKLRTSKNIKSSLKSIISSLSKSNIELLKKSNFLNNFKNISLFGFDKYSIGIINFYIQELLSQIESVNLSNLHKYIDNNISDDNIEEINEDTLTWNDNDFNYLNNLEINRDFLYKSFNPLIRISSYLHDICLLTNEGKLALNSGFGYCINNFSNDVISKSIKLFSNTLKIQSSIVDNVVNEVSINIINNILKGILEENKELEINISIPLLQGLLNIGILLCCIKYLPSILLEIDINNKLEINTSTSTNDIFNDIFYSNKNNVAKEIVLLTKSMNTILNSNELISIKLNSNKIPKQEIIALKKFMFIFDKLASINTYKLTSDKLDSIFDIDLDEAIKKFQRISEIKIDGIIGINTKNAIKILTSAIIKKYNLQ